MQAFPDKSTPAEMPLQLLLFMDKRPSSREQIQQVQDRLKELRADYPFELQVIDVGEEPYLAEHFRLIATPALVKIHPEPRQTLAGSNIVAQIHHWWSQWQRSVEEYLSRQGEARSPSNSLDEQPTGITEELVQNPVAALDEAIDELRARSEEPEAAPVVPPPLTTSKSPALLNTRIRSIVRSTEMIRLSDEVFRLQREKEDLEHQLKFKDQIIAMLAHDLRNPVTAASIALETLEMGHHPEEGWAARLTPKLTAQLLKHGRTQIRAIDRMITDILQAARGGSAGMQIHPHRLDMGDLCLDVLNDLQDRFRSKSQTVEKDIPSDLPLVLADGERVRQVVVNLLDNASKYTPMGGTIALSILHRTSQKIQVSICDTGPGIPEENRDRIFEDHYRLKRDENQEGYGIGLSLCQRIIRSHYGQIWVDSVGHAGSCFHFTLPVFRV